MNKGNKLKKEIIESITEFCDNKSHNARRDVSFFNGKRLLNIQFIQMMCNDISTYSDAYGDNGNTLEERSQYAQRVGYLKEKLNLYLYGDKCKAFFFCTKEEDKQGE